MGDWVRDRNSVSWHKAPLPRRWHGCKPWTIGVLDGHIVYRCACGAMQMDADGYWSERNSRRKGK